MSISSTIVARLLLVPYLVGGISLCILVMDRPHCDSPYYYFGNPTNPGARSFGRAAGNETGVKTNEDEKEQSSLVQINIWDENNNLVPIPEKHLNNRFCAGGYHGLLSLLGTLLLGFTIIIYRILDGMRTRVVKYIHMGLHVVTITLFSVGIWCVLTHEYSITYDEIHFHGLISWVMYGLFCTQFILASMIFTYLYPNTKLRMYAAPFHDIAGIWLFIFCVACCLSGKHRGQIDYVPSNTFYGVAYVTFSSILIVILSPYFEWDVVGPL